MEKKRKRFFGGKLTKGKKYKLRIAKTAKLRGVPQSIMIWRLSFITLLVMTVFILALSSFTDDGPAGLTTAQPLLKDQGVKALAGNTPICFSDALSQISGAHGISPNLVKAMIQVESQGNPKAVSRRGARGLMQLMPEVIKAYQLADPFEPLANMRAGVGHLNYLLLEFSGNLSLALAAYNAGPGTVRQYGGIPPHPETRKYLRSILREYQREGNELEMFMQILRAKKESMENIYEKNYLVRDSNELSGFLIYTEKLIKGPYIGSNDRTFPPSKTWFRFFPPPRSKSTVLKPPKSYDM